MEVTDVLDAIISIIELVETITRDVSRSLSRAESTCAHAQELLVELRSLFGVLHSLRLLATCLQDSCGTIPDIREYRL